MQNAGQYGPGAASAHPSTTQFVPSEPSPTGGSTTSSLRQFRKKDVEKNQAEQQSPPKQMSESHVARVAPQNHYPPSVAASSNDVYRYTTHQFPSGYSPQVKYSDLAEGSQQPNPISTSVIQKPKPKDYMEMCNVQQQHQQQFSPDNGQYMHKDPSQGYPSGFKPESHHYFSSKDQPQYQQMPHHLKFNNMMAAHNMRKYNPAPADNPFLNKLSKLHPSMARSIISDHHLQDTQPAYATMDQRVMYSQQNHRYYSGSMHQSNHYPSSPNYPINTSHSYSNYPGASCNYTTRPSQMSSVANRYPVHMERSLSPNRRGYPPDNMAMSLNYLHQKIPSGHNYSPQYRGPEYAQHYQHRRMPQDAFPQTCRSLQYMPNHHQISGQDMQELSESTVSPSDSLKKFIENWADEEPSGEINSMDQPMTLREKLRDDAPPGTVYMINANDVQYFENNGIPIVTSDNGCLQLSSENCQYIVKSSLVENSGMVRIIEANKEIAIDANGNQERIVNLQIMEAPKPDCMLANKQHPTQHPVGAVKSSSPEDESRGRVVIHQNTILNPASSSSQDQIPLHQSVVDNLSVTKELVDKNCSPINLDQLEHNLGFSDAEADTEKTNNSKSESDLNLNEDLSSQNSDDSQYKSKSMPIIDFFGEHHISGTDDAQEEEETKTDAKSSTVIVEPSVKEEDGIIRPLSRASENSDSLLAPVERRKRIFSVDDIIHNIGNNNMSNRESIACPLKAIKEFIERETEFSSLEQISLMKRVNRRTLRVEGNTAVLEIAGELMEITVNLVNGRKTINVTPLSDATMVVDYNDNYEVSTNNNPEYIEDTVENNATCVDEDMEFTSVNIFKEEHKEAKDEEEMVIENSQSEKADNIENNNQKIDLSDDILTEKEKEEIVATEELKLPEQSLKKTGDDDTIPISDAPESDASRLPSLQKVDSCAAVQVNEESANEETPRPELSTNFEMLDVANKEQVDVTVLEDAKEGEAVDTEAFSVAAKQKQIVSEDNNLTKLEETATEAPENVVEAAKVELLPDEVVSEGDNLVKLEETATEAHENVVEAAKVELLPDEVVDDKEKLIKEENVLLEETKLAQVEEEAIVKESADITCVPLESSSESKLQEPAIQEVSETFNELSETSVSSEVMTNQMPDIIEEKVASNIKKSFSELTENINKESIGEEESAKMEDKSAKTEDESVKMEDESANIEKGATEVMDITEQTCAPLEDNKLAKYEETSIEEASAGHGSEEVELTKVEDKDALDMSILEETTGESKYENCSGSSMKDEMVADETKQDPAPMEENVNTFSEEAKVETSSELEQPGVIETVDVFESVKESPEITTLSDAVTINPSTDVSNQEHDLDCATKKESSKLSKLEGPSAKESSLNQSTNEDLVNSGVFTADDLERSAADEAELSSEAVDDHIENGEAAIITEEASDSVKVQSTDEAVPFAEVESNNLIGPVIELAENILNAIEESEDKTAPLEHYILEETIVSEDIETASVCIDVPIEIHEEEQSFYDMEPLDFPLEDEVFIAEPPAHEVIVSDPLEVTEERHFISPEIPLEPVTTTKEGVKNNTLTSEVQILSPTSTNSEDHNISSKTNVYLNRFSANNECVTSVVTTKAAKKLYESDFRVQHDLVSSSKKEELPNKTKKASAIKRSKRLNEKVQTKNEQKEMLRVLVEMRKRRKELREKTTTATEGGKITASSNNNNNEQDEEYVDFKELLRARKLKKLKKLQESKTKDVVVKKSVTTYSNTREKKTENVCCIGCTPASVKKQQKAVKEEKPIKKPNNETPANVAKRGSVTYAEVVTAKPPESVSVTEEIPTSTSNIVNAEAKIPAAPPPMHPKDPRRRSKVFSGQVIVPSVSELIEENGSRASGKKKISLADYVSRKRKDSNTDINDKEKRFKLDLVGYERAESTESEDSTNLVKPKTLSDMKTSFVIHSSDWEDSSSPVSTPVQSKEERLIEDFSGLIKTNWKKPVIDVNELTPLENPKDRKLQEYKDKVDSQLSSLNIQIPSSKMKQHRSSSGSGSSKSDLKEVTLSNRCQLITRFLNNEKLSQSEMEKIRNIISYKRSMLHRKNGRSPSKSPANSGYSGLSDSPSPNPSYEVRSNSSRLEVDCREVRLHLKRVGVKRKVLQLESEEEEDSSSAISNQSEFSNRKNIGYSVINRLGEDGLPKIIFKRNRKNIGLLKEPVVELVKLDLDDLEKVKEKYNVTVRQSM